MPRHDVICYSQPDHEAAHELVERVEARGIQCWIAPRDVAAGEHFAAAVVRAIYDARVMVLVFSASASRSPHVRREVMVAVGEGVRSAVTSKVLTLVERGLIAQRLLSAEVQQMECSR